MPFILEKWLQARSLQMAKMKSVRTITDTVTDSGIENYEKNCDKASEISIDIVLGLLKEIKAYILGGKNDEE